MNERQDSGALQLSIAAVERDTGLGKDTLRVWERRYGFPSPARDAFGERTYPMEQVEKLRIIKRLMDHGQRPGRIVALPVAGLHALSQSLHASAQAQTPQPDADADAADRCIALIQASDATALRTHMKQTLTQVGLMRFVAEVAVPVSVAVGQAWIRGELEVYQEHFFTECLVSVLRQAIDQEVDGRDQASPRVLLTTLPQEPHGLGLLMAESMLALEGVRCVSLGTQTPVRDIAQGALAHQADIVALSFSVNMNPKHVIAGLAELRQLLPDTVEVWAGGQNPVLKRRKHDGVHTIIGLADIASHVQRWRAAHCP